MDKTNKKIATEFVDRQAKVISQWLGIEDFDKKQVVPIVVDLLNYWGIAYSDYESLPKERFASIFMVIQAMYGTNPNFSEYMAAKNKVKKMTEKERVRQEEERIRQMITQEFVEYRRRKLLDRE